jgi:hypothetical protein
MEGSVDSGMGADFKFDECLLFETLPLIVETDSHAHDFGTAAGVS